MYDNFMLATSASINEVSWTGEYFNPPNQGTITAWTVNFYADAAGQPGSLLESNYDTGTGGETYLGSYAGFPTYTYDVSLAGPFAAAAGTQYWMSIVPDLGFPPQWGWSSGTGGDGMSYQVFFGTGSSIAADMSFTLSGTATVPEPASFALAGIGLGLVGLASWRRRRHGA
jgi:hypothetical protein